MEIGDIVNNRKRPSENNAQDHEENKGKSKKVTASEKATDKTITKEKDSTKKKEDKRIEGMAGKSTITSNNKNIQNSLKYEQGDFSPFIVYIYSKDTSSPPHPLLISKIVSNIAHNNIIESKKLSKGKVMVEL